MTDVSRRSGAWRRDRLRHSHLYLVSDARQDHGDLAEFLEEVLGAGVDIIQLREKSAEAGNLLRWSAVFRAAADRHGALFIVNDRADVALAAGADGVHVGQDDLPAEWARRVIGADALIGLSTHSLEQFAGASAEVDYCCAGPVYATPTKPGRPATGTELLHQAAEHVRAAGESQPWFAIGGIDTHNLAEVVASGAERIAVVRALTQSPHPGDAARRLRGQLEG